MAAFASLRLRSLRLVSSGSGASARSLSRSPGRPRSSSNVTLELLRCPRFFADTALLMSLPSTGVIGVRPLLESPVELAGLLPRRPMP